MCMNKKGIPKLKKTKTSGTVFFQLQGPLEALAASMDSPLHTGHFRLILE